jgi:hypothetical protein
MRRALVHIVVKAEHHAHGLFDGGDLLRSRIAAARYQQHQDRCGIARSIAVAGDIVAASVALKRRRLACAVLFKVVRGSLLPEFFF